ncbi:MAG TPA: hypothetical protein VNV60_09075 [Holophagaceae bacterium]|jgi:hypothetical protein|nr:hypothetical protein [Holophagaceae bacterium]
MNWQSLTVLALVVLAVLYFGRGFVLGLLGRGGCASGGSCSSCGSGGSCTLSKLDALKQEYEARKAAGQLKG